MNNIIRVSEDKTIEVKGFPVYRVGLLHVYKVINNQLAIAVCPLNGSEFIMKVHAGKAFESDESTSCTLLEFNEAYYKVANTLFQTVI